MEGDIPVVHAVIQNLTPPLAPPSLRRKRGEDDLQAIQTLSNAHRWVNLTRSGDRTHSASSGFTNGAPGYSDIDSSVGQAQVQRQWAIKTRRSSEAKSVKSWSTGIGELHGKVSHDSGSPESIWRSRNPTSPFSATQGLWADDNSISSLGEAEIHGQRELRSSKQPPMPFARSHAHAHGPNEIHPAHNAQGLSYQERSFLKRYMSTPRPT